MLIDYLISFARIKRNKKPAKTAVTVIAGIWFQPKIFKDN